LSGDSKFLGVPFGLSSSMSSSGDGGGFLSLEVKSISSSSGDLLVWWSQAEVWVGGVKESKNGWDFTVDLGPFILVHFSEVLVGDVSSSNTGDSCLGSGDVVDCVKIALSYLLAGGLVPKIVLVAGDHVFSDGNPRGDGGSEAGIVCVCGWVTSGAWLTCGSGYNRSSPKESLGVGSLIALLGDIGGTSGHVNELSCVGRVLDGTGDELACAFQRCYIC